LYGSLHLLPAGEAVEERVHPALGVGAELKNCASYSFNRPEQVEASRTKESHIDREGNL